MKWAAWIVGSLLALGCAGTVAPPIEPLEPLPSLAARVPGALDRRVRDLARAVLADDSAAIERQLAELVALEEERARREEGPSGLLPYALDARNATLGDTQLRRLACRALLERRDLEPALRKRIEEEVEDDPLALAERRLRDRSIVRFGRAANAVMESLGRSGTNPALLPFRLSKSLIDIALAEHLDDELSTQERQALAHWKRFVERHPGSPEATRLLERIDEAELRWSHTRRDGLMRKAREALEAGNPELAATQAERALRYAPEDARASALASRVEEQVRARRARRARTLEADPQAFAWPHQQRALALALLVPGDRSLARAAALAQGITELGPDAPLASEARYVLALAAGARGVEDELWDRFETLAEEPDEVSPMARHARQEWSSPDRHPYPAFRLALRAARGTRLRATLLGPLAEGARDRELPRWVEVLVELPTAVSALAGLPVRLIRAPFQQTDLAVPAVLARRVLERSPDGPHAAQVRRWLIDFERSRGNHVGALALLAEAPGASPEEMDALRADAAQQAYEASLEERRRDVRIHLLMDVARRFPGTEGGQKAGEAVREALRNLSSQNIRISRGFLLENPQVAGPQGLALRPELFDDDPSNGELHPDGVRLLGERVLEIALLDGRPSQPPQKQQKRISAKRLARLVAQLEEATLHTLLTDSDAPVEHDADRDFYFERARLGAVHHADLRPHAESSYQFLGMRERYGLVRSRDSILPVQLVLQGSFDDFALGAFPRIRMPRTTPDALLFQDR